LSIVQTAITGDFSGHLPWKTLIDTKFLGLTTDAGLEPEQRKTLGEQFW